MRRIESVSERFDFRMVGEENFRIPFKDSAQDRRKSQIDERNNFRDTSDKDVHVGEAFRSARAVCKKVLCVLDYYYKDVTYCF